MKNCGQKAVLQINTWKTFCAVLKDDGRNRMMNITEADDGLELKASPHGVTVAGIRMVSVLGENPCTVPQ